MRDEVMKKVTFQQSLCLFIFGCAGSSLPCGLFSGCGQWGYSLVVVCGLLIAVASLAAEHCLQGTQASVVGLRGSRAQAQQLWSFSEACETLPDQGSGPVSCIGWQILYHWPTRKPSSLAPYFWKANNNSLTIPHPSCRHHWIGGLWLLDIKAMDYGFSICGSQSSHCHHPHTIHCPLETPEVIKESGSGWWLKAGP